MVSKVELVTEAPNKNTGETFLVIWKAVEDTGLRWGSGHVLDQGNSQRHFGLLLMAFFVDG